MEYALFNTFWQVVNMPQIHYFMHCHPAAKETASIYLHSNMVPGNCFLRNDTLLNQKKTYIERSFKKRLTFKNTLITLTLGFGILRFF